MAIDASKVNILSFFSGALGLDMGFNKVGFKSALFCENDNNCIKTIKYNKPNVPLIEDVRNYDYKEIMKKAGVNKKDNNIIIGGPPCQAFSTIGKRRSFEDERGNVFIYFLKMAMNIEPDFLVIENVRGLYYSFIEYSCEGLSNEEKEYIKNQGGQEKALSYITRFLSQSGYGYCFNLYNTHYFGVPQSRERFLLIASKKHKKIPFLEPTHSNDLNNLSSLKTFREATQYIKNHNHMNFSKRKKDFYNMIPEGGNWKNLPLEQQKNALGKSFYLGGGKTGYLRRLSWDKPSPTLLTSPVMNATSLCHPVENRPLSIEEYKTIQQFPENYMIKGGLSSQYKQIGNAVPVGFSTAVARLILKIYNNQYIENNDNFNFSRYKKTSHKDWFDR